MVKLYTYSTVGFASADILGDTKTYYKISSYPYNKIHVGATVSDSILYLDNLANFRRNRIITTIFTAIVKRVSIRFIKAKRNHCKMDIFESTRSTKNIFNGKLLSKVNRYL